MATIIIFGTTVVLICAFRYTYNEGFEAGVRSEVERQKRYALIGAIFGKESAEILQREARKPMGFPPE